jgi:hypothetical protein
MFCHSTPTCGGSADEARHLAQVVVHQRDVGGLERGVGAGRAHGEADGPGPAPARR